MRTLKTNNLFRRRTGKAVEGNTRTWMDVIDGHDSSEVQGIQQRGSPEHRYTFSSSPSSSPALPRASVL